MLSKFTGTYFFTATINCRQQLLRPDNRKEIVLKALKFLATQGKIRLHAYAVMSNHIHLLLTLTRLFKFMGGRKDLVVVGEGINYMRKWLFVNKLIVI